MAKAFMYQLALRRADDKKKQFIIERDTVLTDVKLTNKDLENIANEHNCDVKAEYLGILTQPKEKDKKTLEAEFHTLQMIEDYIEKWKSPTEVKNGKLT
jgi:hypothetical protein